jgi:predicted SnoaL-like aldol condensation-catalyzing enzyme
MKLVVAAALLCVAAAPALAGTAENAAVAKRVFDDIYNKRDFAATASIYAPGFVNHGRTRDIGLAEDQAAAKTWCDMFPDLHVDVVQQVADGDLVTLMWIAQATKPGTAQHLKVRGITIWRVRDGCLAEEWSEFDERRAPGT